MLGTHSHVPLRSLGKIELAGCEILALSRCSRCSCVIVRPVGADMFVRWLSIADYWRSIPEVWELRAIIAEHTPHQMQFSDFGTRNCRVCGMPWKAMRLAGAYVYGCRAVRGAWLALYQRRIGPRALIVPVRLANSA